MVRAELTDGGVRATDASRTSVAVTTEGFRDAGPARPLPLPTDETVTGTVRALGLPSVDLRAERVDGAGPVPVGGTGTTELPAGDYLLRADAGIRVALRFYGAATLVRTDRGRSTLSFPEPTPVTVGFRSRDRAPTDAVTVPRTPEGVARGVAALAAAHRTPTPDRSFPAFRRHPPLIEFGTELSIPPAVAERRSRTDVTVRLPPALPAVFTAAPLVYYLGADVRVEPGATPAVLAPSVERELGPLPESQTSAAALLRRVFTLDCLVRTAGPYGTDLAERRHLRTLGLDADRLYRAGSAARLRRYLDVPFEAVSDDLPEWPLSMYVEPTYRHARALPHLLDPLAHVFVPSSSPLPTEERLERSLDKFYRSEAGTPPHVELVNPELGPGHAHGWLATGVPIDAYKAVPEAYGNRLSYLDREDGPVSVVTVVNELEMDREGADAARIYRDRAAADGVGLDVSVRKRLTRAELRSVFESEHDLVHYVGHCEESGLRCVDGHLSAAEVGESDVQTFFLNACGSLYEGVKLVQRGSVAGAVTAASVLDGDAARVGTAFARLLVRGFSIRRALALARRRIMMGKDYTVVGDGTHSLVQTPDSVPPVLRVDRAGDRYRLRYDVTPPDRNGGRYRPRLRSDGGFRLFGTDRERLLDRAGVLAAVERTDAPVIYDGDIHWSDEFADCLDGG